MARKIPAKKKAVKLKMSQTEQIVATQQILEQIGLGQPSSETLQTVLEQVSSATKFPAVVLEIFDAPSRAMIWKAVQGIDIAAIGMSFADSISGEVVRSRSAHMETNLSARTDPYSEFWKAKGLSYLACFPLTTGSDRCSGTLTFAHSETVDIDKSLLQWLQGVATVLGFFCEANMAREATQNLLSEAETVHQKKEGDLKEAREKASQEFQESLDRARNEVKETRKALQDI